MTPDFNSGFNGVVASRIIAIVNPSSSPMKRLREAWERTADRRNPGKEDQVDHHNRQFPRHPQCHTGRDHLNRLSTAAARKRRPSLASSGEDLAPALPGRKIQIIKEIVKRKTDIVLSVSYTTRPPRPGEQDGIDYFFISRPAFERMIRSDAFLEWAQVHENLYGTSMAWIEREERQGHHVLFDIDVQGVILILPPSMDELERRLSERGTEDPQALILRTQNAKNELSNWALYDYLVVNESLEQCIDDIATIIDAYRSSREVVIGELPWLKAIA